MGILSLCCRKLKVIVRIHSSLFWSLKFKSFSWQNQTSDFNLCQNWFYMFLIRDNTIHTHTHTHTICWFESFVTEWSAIVESIVYHNFLGSFIESCLVLVFVSLRRKNLIIRYTKPIGRVLEFDYRIGIIIHSILMLKSVSSCLKLVFGTYYWNQFLLFPNA